MRILKTSQRLKIDYDIMTDVSIDDERMDMKWDQQSESINLCIDHLVLCILCHGYFGIAIPH